MGTLLGPTRNARRANFARAAHVEENPQQAFLRPRLEATRHYFQNRKASTRLKNSPRCLPSRCDHERRLTPHPDRICRCDVAEASLRRPFPRTAAGGGLCSPTRGEVTRAPRKE